MNGTLARTFTSLGVPNYRRYVAGQLASISGNWMQNIAEAWLILKLTGSGALVGVTTGLQFLPILLFAPWGGLIADRTAKRRLLTITQTLMAIPPLSLFGLTASGHVRAWMVLAVVGIRGTVNAFDNPARQAFVVEMVGADRVVNAISLNSVMVHCARILGPAAAGGVIAAFGVAPCFLVNSLSFGVMLVALRSMDPAALRSPLPASPGAGELRSAMRYVLRTPELLVPLSMMALVGTLSFNFQVLLPLLARFTWHGTASTYAALTAAMGVGSVGGALAAGARAAVTPRVLVGSSLAFGGAEFLATVAPSLPSQLLALIPLGAASVTFQAGINSALQLAVRPLMRGRVMALYSVVYLGSTPIGSPAMGWLAQVASPRAGLLVGAIAAFVAGAGARLAFARAR